MVALWVLKEDGGFSIDQKKKIITTNLNRTLLSDGPGRGKSGAFGAYVENRTGALQCTVRLGFSFFKATALSEFT